MRAGDLIADRFEVERLAGVGGMGEVYRARDRATGEPVAVKVLKRAAHGAHDTLARQRFGREAQALATLQQEGVVRYLGHGTTPDGAVFLVMEWLEGETLGELLARRTLSIGETIVLGVRAAHALGAVHARGFIHRDLKPSNLFLRDRHIARVVLIDFGVARDRGEDNPLTHTGSVLGTIGFMAPEQARGVREVGPQADVFSLGCVLYKCLTGRAPFSGDDMVSVLLKVIAEDPRALREVVPDLPPELEAAIDRMLAKPPGGRPAHGAEVAAMLEAIAESVSVSTATDGDAALVGRDHEARHEARDISSAPTLTAFRSAVGRSRPPPARELTSLERRVVCLVLARDLLAARASPDARADHPIDARSDEDARLHEIAAIARRHRGDLDRLADRSVLVTFTSAGAATDLAVRAARCALAIHELHPEAPVALVTGRSVLEGGAPGGTLGERAAALSQPRPPATPTTNEAAPVTPVTPVTPATPVTPVRIDDASAALLGARFDIARGDLDHELVREREPLEVGRTVLGRPVPCVGRETELAALEASFARAVEEPAATVVLVTAPPGMGKSRVRDELLRRIRAREGALSVWTCQGDPMSAGSPFGLVGQALRSVVGIRDGDAPAARRGVLLGWATRVVRADPERVAAFLGEVCGVPFPDDVHPHLGTARRDPQRMLDQTRRAFTDALRAACEPGPLVLVLEDLHWGDLPTVKLVDAALAALTDVPLFVVALARPEVTDLFPGLWSERGVAHVRLPPLSRKASERLVRHALGDAADPTLVKDLVERAAGHAFYLEELVRVVAAGAGDTLPETVLAMVQARLEALDPEARRVLRAASVFGQTFWQSGLQTLVGTGPLAAHLAALEGAELVTRRHEPRFAGEIEYAFRHGLVRDAAYGMLTDADRTLGHRLAAAWLERAGETDAMRMAEHEERADSPVAAAAWYHRAAAQALDGGDSDAALARAARALSLLGADADAESLAARPDPHIGELNLFQAGVFRIRAASADQLRAGERAMTHLPPAGAAWCAAAAEVIVAAGKLALRDRVLALAAALLATGTTTSATPTPSTAPTPEDPATAARRAIALARAVPPLLYLDCLPLADALLALAEQVAAQAGEDLPVLAEITRARGSRALVTGDIGLYLEHVEKVRACYERMGDRRGALTLKVALGYALAQLGDHDASERILREAAAEADRLRFVNAHALAIENLGMTLCHLGRHAEALRLEEQAVAEFERQGDRRMVAGARIYLATAQRLAGDLAAARATARLVLDDPTTPVPFQALTWGVLSRAHLTGGDAPQALAAAESGLTVLARTGTLEEGEAGIHLAHSEALHACGRLPEAHAALGAARDRLLARAARIAAPHHREGFLHRVPDHARILQLAADWLAPPAPND